MARVVVPVLVDNVIVTIVDTTYYLVVAMRS